MAVRAAMRSDVHVTVFQPETLTAALVWGLSVLNRTEISELQVFADSHQDVP